MSEVDQFEYMKSCEAQGINLDCPYTSKNWNYTNDINQSIYSNANGLTLVQYNLSNLFNSSQLIDTKECFLLIPTVTAVRLTDGADPTAVIPSTTAYGVCSLKTNNASIIHQMDLQINGKTVSQLQPYSNLMYGFDMASKMSKDDLTLHGKIRGWSQQLDNPVSAYYSATPANPATSCMSAAIQHAYGGAGPGIANNSPWGQGTNLGSAEVATSQQLQFGVQGFGTVNGAIQERINNITFNGPSYSNFNGTLVSKNNFNQEFKPYCEIVNGDIVYYDYLYIDLGDVCEVMENIGLIRKFDAVLRIYVNTGMITTSVIPNPDNAACSTLRFRGPSYSTFTNTCPITINSLGLKTNYSANDFTDITAFFGIGRSVSYAINTYGDAGVGASVNFGSNYQSQIQSTRFYYPSIVLDSLKMSDYLASQQSKTVLGRQFYYNTYSNIQPSASFSQLVQSGVRNVKSVVIIPLISQTVNGFSQFQSPFDPCGGCSFAALSLINLQVLVGGIQARTTALSYQYEDWLEEISIYNKSSSSEYGVESGLISKEFWDNNRVYLLNIRGTLDDALTPRNISVNFINNSLVPIDVYFYTIYEDEWTVNCSTGEVNQKM